MPRCPNCGRSTARTEDWCCQWCGYPLLSNSYKKIPKTYRQLKEERLYQQKPPVIEETEVSLPPIQGALPPIHKLQPEPEPAPEPEAVLEPEPTPESRPKRARKSKPKPEPEPTPRPKPKRARKSNPKPKPEAVLEPEPTPKPKPEPEPESAPEIIEATAEELLSAYEADGVAADAKFANKILKVTGVVGRIEVKDFLDIHYITLTSAEKNLLQNVRCMFDRKHGPELNQLTPGQTVTVQGKYDGSIINFRMTDCALVH